MGNYYRVVGPFVLGGIAERGMGGEEPLGYSHHR